MNDSANGSDAAEDEDNDADINDWADPSDPGGDTGGDDGNMNDPADTGTGTETKEAINT
ncbi:hypothetical protein B0H16DRAFT_1748458 [Mycena metata]|uniref:Uncharacterized protein n=1 Tax=Mycena metata TaxID=1033252 RepID=A0AAD7DWT7_9AGAR|nr:hypothetical protein B0H16DRAFT_1748458 [Mycena metata]